MIRERGIMKLMIPANQYVANKRMNEYQVHITEMSMLRRTKKDGIRN